jgi:uncharacterized membrane protein
MKKEMDGMSSIVARNIKALYERKKQEESRKTFEEKLADRITAFTGSMKFIYIHLVLFGFWLLYNSGWFNVNPFDPTYVILAMFASVEAIFLSTFVLISQNRMNIQADKRAELDLQVSLLTEHEVTKMIDLLTRIARKTGVENVNTSEMEELKKDVLPEKVLDTMEKESRNSEGL